MGFHNEHLCAIYLRMDVNECVCFLFWWSHDAKTLPLNTNTESRARKRSYNSQCVAMHFIRSLFTFNATRLYTKYPFLSQTHCCNKQYSTLTHIQTHIQQTSFYSSYASTMKTTTMSLDKLSRIQGAHCANRVSSSLFPFATPVQIIWRRFGCCFFCRRCCCCFCWS